jgi:Fungal Zn(2)-Cys(6) binuclear cluster domain
MRLTIRGKSTETPPQYKWDALLYSPFIPSPRNSTQNVMTKKQQRQETSRQRPISCEFCRSRKLRCSREAPCSNCIARGLRCELENTTKQSTPESEILQRLDRLERLLSKKHEHKSTAGQESDKHLRARPSAAVQPTGWGPQIQSLTNDLAKIKHLSAGQVLSVSLRLPVLSN